MSLFFTDVVSNIAVDFASFRVIPNQTALLWPIVCLYHLQRTLPPSYSMQEIRYSLSSIIGDKTGGRPTLEIFQNAFLYVF